MRETDKNSENIIQDMLSRDNHKMWKASCNICSLSQNHDKIVELLPYKDQMVTATINVNLGGATAPNNRFLKKAFEIIYFHENNTQCPCCLLGEDSHPIHLVEDEYFTLLDTVCLEESSYIDYYLVSCNQCNKIYKVEQREYHYTWWNWIEISEE